jgi:hypothetical protein
MTLHAFLIMVHSAAEERVVLTQDELRDAYNRHVSPWDVAELNDEYVGATSAEKAVA